MTVNMLFDAIGKVDDTYVVSAGNRLEDASDDGSVKYRSVNRKGANFERVNHRSVYRKILVTAATVFLVLLSSFTVAMAANEEFRNAVFRLFHISEPITVPPLGEGEGEQDQQITIVDNAEFEDMVDVEYIRVKGGFGHTTMGGIVYANDVEAGRVITAYAVVDGELSELEAHKESLEYTWGDNTYKIDFNWYDNNGVIRTFGRNFDLDTGTEWLTCGEKDGYVHLELSHGSQIDYGMYPLLYNLKTHEVVDVLSECEELKSQNILEAYFSPDLSKILVTCGEAAISYEEENSTVYCYDIVNKTLQSLTELCQMDVKWAWFLDDDTVCCLWYDQEDNEILRTLTLSSGEYIEVFSDMQGSYSDGGGLSMRGNSHGLLVEEDGSTYIFDFRTGESFLVDGFQYSSGFDSVSFNADGTKLLFTQFSLGEDVWVTQIGILDIEKKSFITFEREGEGTPHETTVSWFDNERVGIEANTDEYWYLYLYTVHDLMQ